MLRPATVTIFASAAVLPVLAACSSDKGSGSGISIKAADSSCRVATTTLDAGNTTFTVKNDGSKVTEVYVYGRNGDEFSKVITEVENIGPGTSRDMKVKLGAGTYEIACKPGQQGDGIRTTIRVGSGASTGSPAGTTEAEYDRKIELSTDGTSISGVSGGANRGEKIEFKLENKASGARTLEIKNPAGAVAAEAEDIAAGEDGEVVVELNTAGTWQIIVEGEGIEDIATPLTVS